MRILWTFCVYNEIELLPFKIDYIRKNNIECFVFDNMSTDGSWQWLQENRIPSQRFDSKNMFNLKLNTELMILKIHEIKPHWAMFAGTDGFYVHRNHKNLRETIKWLDKAGYNTVNDSFNTFMFMYTGSERKDVDPRLEYMYYMKRNSLHQRTIAKYYPGMNIIADSFKFPNIKSYSHPSDFVFLHYSLRSDGAKRKIDQYLRRKKAWDSKVIPLHWGRHYRDFAQQKKFIYDKESLRDIRNSQFWNLIQDSVQNG